MPYQPSQKILDKYAYLLVNFALNSGKGVRPGEVVFVQVPECAKPMLVSLQRAILKAKAQMIIQYLPDGLTREFYQLANDKQLTYFPAEYMKARVNTIDHLISITADSDMHELEGINPKKIMEKQKSWKPYIQWRDDKEYKERLTWVVALYGTDAMAKEAKISLKEYWKEIIKVCYIYNPDPIKKWKQIFREVNKVKSKLNRLNIESVHIKSKDTDLTIGIGKNRKWVGCDGRNIPSFEIFTTPDCRNVSGHVNFNVPLYRYGTLIEGIRLEFKNGKIVKATAKKNEKFLKELIKAPGAGRIGEFSLTDSRLSKITRFMAKTLFDENRGGKFGNTHIAIGKSYKDTYPGSPGKVPKAKWKKMGYNDSAVHVDLMSTDDRIVTAKLENGKQVVIYRKGRFTV